MARAPPAQASWMPSRMVGRSRIEMRSASSVCSTRCTPPTVICDGISSATSFCCSRGSSSSSFCVSAKDSSSAMVCRTISVRWVASTLGGSTTVQPRNTASSRSDGSIHSAGRPNAGSMVRSPGQVGHAALRVHRQQHAGADFAAAGLDLLDADRVAVLAPSCMLSWMRTGGSTKPISAAMVRRSALDLLGQPRRVAAGQRQQPVARVRAGSCPCAALR